MPSQINMSALYVQLPNCLLRPSKRPKKDFGLSFMTPKTRARLLASYNKKYPYKSAIDIVRAILDDLAKDNG